MDATHLHLILTHFPIVGTIIGIGILAYGQFGKNDDVKKVALVTFVIMAILTIPVFLTGGEAEESVEHIAGVSEQLIENHEELAEKAIWLMGLLGVLSLINFFVIIKKLSFAKTISLITLIVSLGTFGLFAKVGSTGGEIRHSEIRTTNVNNDNGIFNSGENEEHDDDDD
jgi:uncharacterized membrane protein